jgi:IclR family transcriptional regulator, acetate operon repressor
VLGKNWPLHASAGGKVLLAWRLEQEARQLLTLPLKRYTASTITTFSVLNRELKQVRRRGYSTVRGEFLDDVWGVAVPVFNHREALEGAITLGGPRSRVTRTRVPELADTLLAAGEQLSRALGYARAYPRA